MTRVILIRHGETAWNSERRIQGRTDIPLSRKGQGQARRVAERLARLEPAAVYTSDLKRAAATARAVARLHHGVPVVTNPLLRERNWGALEGKRWDQIERKHRNDVRLILSGAATYRPRGGESKQDVLARALEFFQSLPEKHPDATVAVVTHGGFCSVLLKHVLGIDLSRRPPFFMENCAISVLDSTGNGEWFVRTLNDMAHLEDL